MTTPPDDTTENLRERLTETLNTTVVTPEGGIERSTSKFDRHGRHNFLYNCVVCQGNVPAIVSTVLAALAGDPGDLPAQMQAAIEDVDCPHNVGEDYIGEDCANCIADAALSVRSEHEAQLAGRWGDATRRAELAETRMERLKADLEEAYAERDQQFERKVAALRERDEAKQQLAEAQRTIAAHERHINDAFEANQRVLQKVREQRDEAQDERDALIDEVKTLQEDPEEFGEAQKAWLQFRRERDALKAAIGQVRADAIEQRRATGVTKDRWKLGVYAQACRTLGIFNAAMDAPEIAPDAPTDRED